MHLSVNSVQDSGSGEYTVKAQMRLFHAHWNLLFFSDEAEFIHEFSRRFIGGDLLTLAGKFLFLLDDNQVNVC